MNVTEAGDINTVLDWAMGRPHHNGHPSDLEATAAGARLAARAHKTLAAGLHPRDVDLVRASTIARLQDIEASIAAGRRTRLPGGQP